ncbi:hypothetical protein PMZ80_003081 [Knufia obscura]|uniref:Uncharacterized protein n=1 Tax=Knufia obscura TaxID=1635080 RepID=A0ABR0RT70_9EURO|nr:hypothetical protein PMZ80_003081 [Knufia obscura]
MLIDLIQRTQRILQAAPSLFESSHPEAKADVERLLATARAQLSSVRAWPLRIPDYWQMETMHPQMEEAEISQLDIFPGRVHVYQSLYASSGWNTYRTTLLRLCDVIAQCGQYLETDAMPFRETEEYQALQATARDTGEAICSSVAYNINNDWVSRITGAGSPMFPKALGGLLLIWPLFGGSILSIVPDVQRAWMRRKLRSIGISMGLAQAVVLADTVDLRGSTDPSKPLILAQGHFFMWIPSMF